MTICCGSSSQFPDYHQPLPVRLGGRPSGGKIRHQRLADFAVDRLRLRRERDPARRRGDPPRRDRCRALHRHRRLDQSGSADPLLAAVGAVDQQRRARKRRPSRSPRTATASSWPKAPARWCWKATKSAKARGAKILGVLEGCGEMADAFHRTRSSPDGKPIIGCIANAIEGRRPHARRHRLRQRARHQHAGKRQDGISRRARPCSASA